MSERANEPVCNEMRPIVVVSGLGQGVNKICRGPFSCHGANKVLCSEGLSPVMTLFAFAS